MTNTELRDLIKAKNLRRKDIAKATKISYSYLSAILNGFLDLRPEMEARILETIEKMAVIKK